MPVILMKHKYLLIAIFSFLSLSIICQITAGVIFQRLIHEANNMAATENRLLKQCKQKYSNYYKLNGRMVNTSVFVDKFIRKMKYLKLPLSHLSHIAGQLMMLSVLVTGLTICLSLAAGDTLFQIIPYYLISILGLYLYFSVSGIVDIQEKKKALKTDMVDYLENHFAPRLEIEKESDAKEAAEGSREAINFLKEGMLKKQEESNKRSLKPAFPLGSEYQEELEDLLREFFA